MPATEGAAVPETGRRRDFLAIAGLIVVLLLIALAAILPWRPEPAGGGAALARYAPVRDGSSQLSARYSPSGDLLLWRSGNLSLLRDGRALAVDLTRDQRTTLTAFYFGDESPDQATLLKRLAGVQVMKEQALELTPDGGGSSNTNVRFREPRGEYLLAIVEAGGSELLFNPPARVLPADWSPGARWESSGALNQVQYTFGGEVVSRGSHAGILGTWEDCVTLRVRFVIHSGDAVLSEQSWLDTYCAGVGLVAEEEYDASGALTARLAVHRSDAVTGAAAAPIVLPRAEAVAALDAEPADSDPAGWEILRVGRVRAGADASSSTTGPVYVDASQPMLLAAAYEGDLTALDAANPTSGVLWRFHPGGTIYGAPLYDADRGRIYFGASDKRLYAIDERGLFLWSFVTGDNVASRPVQAGGTVIFGSEDRRVYAVDAETGALRWRHDTGAAVVSSPALIQIPGDRARSLVVIGSDDGGVYALDVATGQQAWLYVTAGPVEAPIMTASLPGETPVVYAVSRSGELAALDAATGKPRWSANAGRVLRTAPAITADRVFLIDEEGFLNAFDAATGRRVWTSLEYDYVGWPVVTSGSGAVQTEDTLLLAAGSDGSVHLVSTAGKRLKRWDAAAASEPGDGAKYQFAPALSEDAAWTIDERGVIRRLGPRMQGPAPLTLAWEASVGAPPFTMDLVRTTPIHAGQEVLQLDDGGHLYRIDAFSGAAERVASLPLTGVRLDPVLAGDLVLAVGDGKMSAARLSNGGLAWSVDVGTVTQSPLVVGDTVLLVSQAEDGSRVLLSSYALTDGRLLWEARHSGVPLPGGVTVRGHLAYLSTPPAAYNWRTGLLQWQADGDIARTNGSPALDEAGEVFYAGRITDEDRGELLALDAATGAVRWRADMGSLALSLLESPLVGGDTVVIPTLTGELIAYNAATGAERWRQPAGRGRFGGALLHNGIVWAAYQDGEIVGLDSATGEMIARRVAPELGLDSYGFAQRPLVVSDPQRGERLLVAWGTSLRSYIVPGGGR